MRVPSTLLFLACFFLMAFGQCKWAHQDKSAEQDMKSLPMQLERAEEKFREGKFQEAYFFYSSIVERIPTNVAALERLGTISLWHNRPTEAVNYFERAVQAARLQKFWPFSANLNTRLALANYRMNNFPKAALYFKKAAGPVAFSSFQSLDALGNWLASFGNKQPYLIEGPSETRINFVVTDPLPVVEVFVGDHNREPLLFLIDTGGSEVILDENLAESMGIQIESNMVGQFAGSREATMGLGQLDFFKLGDFVIKNLPVQTLDLSGLATVFDGLQIKGIIGTRLLMQFLATINYREGRLVLQRDSLNNQKILANLVSQSHHSIQIPFWLVETHYIVTWGTVNQTEPMIFVVDTGLAGVSFMPMESTVKKAGIIVDWSKAEEGIGGAGKIKSVNILIDQLTLGSGRNELVEYNALGSVHEQPPFQENTFAFHIGGLISHQFFRNYSVTFDFRNMKLIVF